MRRRANGKEKNRFDFKRCRGFIKRYFTRSSLDGFLMWNDLLDKVKRGAIKYFTLIDFL